MNRIRTDLVVEHLDDEVMVLDPVNGQVHLLRGEAADAFRGIDSPGGAQALAEAGLLAPLSRRRLLQGAALGGGALVTTLALPTATAAASGSTGTTTTPTGYDLYTIAASYEQTAAQSGAFTFWQVPSPTNPVTAAGLASGSIQAPYFHSYAAGISGFTGNDTDRSPHDIPIFITNTTAQQYSTTPAHTFLFHPSQTSDATVRFQNPGGAPASFTAHGVFTDVDNGGGDSASVALYAVGADGTSVVLTTSAAYTDLAGGSRTLTATGALPAGGSVLAQVNRKGAYDYDSTTLSLQITIS